MRSCPPLPAYAVPGGSERGHRGGKPSESIHVILPS